MTKKSRALVPSPQRGPTAAQRKQQSMRDKLTAALERLPKGTFAKGGGMIGGMLAGPKGYAAGTAIGHGIATITGYGDYTVKANTILKSGFSSELERSPVDDLPQFVRGAHTVNVKHREYFGDLLVPTDPASFNNTAYTIQPSNVSLFPWLARIARQYQQYRIRGMVVEYKSNTTDYAAAGPLGNVGIATNYNVADSKFDSLVEFQNSEFAVVAKPSKNILHAIECSPAIGRGEWLYVRDTLSEDPSAVQDARFNDFGLLQICTSGLPGATGQTLGQLWVSYDIEFAKPVLGSVDPGPVTASGMLVVSNPNSDALVSTSSSAMLYRQWNCNGFAPAINTTYRMFEASQVTSSTGNISTGIVALTTDDFQVKQPGKYIIQYYVDALTGTSSQLRLGGFTSATTDAIITYGTGNAGSFTATGVAKCPHVCTGSTNSTWTWSLTYVLDLTEVTPTTPATIAAPGFTTDSTALVPSIARGMRIWYLGTEPGTYLP